VGRQLVATARTAAVASGLLVVGGAGRGLVGPRAAELFGLLTGRSSGPVRFDRLLLDLLGLVGVLTYLGVVGSVALTVGLAAARGPVGRPPNHPAARTVVRWAALVSGVCGLGMAVAPAGSSASWPAATHDRDRPEVARPDDTRPTLTGLPMPALPAAGITTPDRPVVVVPGDCLWRIAADRLPAPATDVGVAAAVDRWYTRNRAVIGPDPDLILPGTRLEQPGGPR
jgi:hypothetical protein